LPPRKIEYTHLVWEETFFHVCLYITDSKCVQIILFFTHWITPMTVAYVCIHMLAYIYVWMYAWVYKYYTITHILYTYIILYIYICSIFILHNWSLPITILSRLLIHSVVSDTQSFFPHSQKLTRWRYLLLLEPNTKFYIYIHFWVRHVKKLYRIFGV
jgi:hypothetical protein